MKDQFELTVSLKEISVTGSGVGRDWSINLDANGLKKSITRSIASNSSVSFSGASSLMGRQVVDHYLNGTMPLKLSIDCVEDDPVHDDKGSGYWEGTLTLRRGVVPRSVWATVAGVGGDAGNAVTLEALFEYDVKLTRPAKLVTTPDWWTVFKWAVEYGVPVDVLREVMTAGIRIVEKSDLDPQSAQYSDGTVSLASDLYAQLTSGRLDEKCMGVVFNEVFHAWYDQVLGDDSWVAALMEYEASINYAGRLSIHQVGRNLHRDMVEEAMSETWEAIVQHMVLSKRRMQPIDLGPGLAQNPGHNEPGKALHGLDDAGKKLGSDPYYVTLYTLHYGDRLPAGVSAGASQPDIIDGIIRQLEANGLKKP